ncbi:MAG: hypothetical protein L6R40_003392 [Gallowayella cf. fulva]|nr:MAG: hypothetical protein L6R40_003392 [Xanthomendoza cf. fulva]
MTTWRQDYLLALQARDRTEQAQKTLYDEYTRLADRAAAADAQRREETAEPDPTPTEPLKSPAQTTSHTDALSQIQQNLSEAQRSRSNLQSQLHYTSSTLKKSRTQSAIDKKRLEELASEKATLALRLRDRDEELKGKAKLLEVRYLSLNMAEDKVQKLKKENEELVERWMARMGEEANAMNEASKFT